MKRSVIAIAALAVLAPLTATAQSDFGFRGWGPRLGLTMDPDQIHFGVHADFGNLGSGIRFQPNFELGFGDDLTVGALNAEAAYRFNENWESWSPYLGGGVGLNIVGSENDGLLDDSDTDVGVNVLGGVERGLSGGDRFFGEVKLGLTDSPDAKFTVGWTFY